MEYGIVFQSFKDLYNSLFNLDLKSSQNSKKDLIKSLKNEQSQKISNRVQKQFKRLNLPKKCLNKKEIEEILQFCVEVIRNYQNRQFVSLDTLNKELEARNDSLDLISQVEDNKEFSQIKGMIQLEFSKKSISHQVILLWLGLEIKQTDFIQILGVKEQFQVSREFKKYLKNILKEIITKVFISQPEMTTKKINQLCNDNIQVIKDYLHHYSQEYFTQILIEIINNNSKKLNISTLESNQNNLNSLINIFQKTIDEQLNIELQKFASAPQKMDDFIRKTISNNQALLQ